MRAALAIAGKDLRLLLRDRPGAFFTFVFPLAIAVFFGYVFSGTGSEPLRVAVLVERAAPAAESLAAAIAADGAFTVERVSSRAEGEARVRRGDAAALLVVPGSYEADVDGLFGGGGARLSLVVDPSRRAEGAMLVGKVHEVAFRTVFASLADPEVLGRMLDRAERSLAEADMPITDRLAIRTAIARARSMASARAAARGEPETPTAPWTPVSVGVEELAVRPGVPANSFAISFMQGIAWALLGAVSAFTSGLAEERERGTMVRLMAAPLRPSAILAGKALGCFAACMSTEWLLVAVGTAFFGVEVSGWWALVAVTSATAFCFSGCMMLLAAAFRTQGAAHGAGRAVLLVLALVGGGSVPVVFMPPFLRWASNASPFKWAVVAAEGATWRAWGAEELVLPVAALLAVGAAGLLAGARLVRHVA